MDHLAEKNPHRFLLEKTLPDMRLSEERCLLRTKHGWRIYRRFDLSALNIIANALNETSTNGTVQQSSSEKLYDKSIFK